MILIVFFFNDVNCSENQLKEVNVGGIQQIRSVMSDINCGENQLKEVDVGCIDMTCVVGGY